MIQRVQAGFRSINSKPISFKFDNKQYLGFEGETLASALLANGIHLVGRSFKYHRPRGILSAGCEEPNALVQLESGNITEPNVKATEVLLYEGLTANSQNNWPNLKTDFGSINNFLSAFFPAGFYYKTFMWPPKFWGKYEYFIRHAAGLGKSPKENDPHSYEHFLYHCDVLIVGGGIGGLLAAKKLISRSQKNKILLVEQSNELGGNTLEIDYIEKLKNKILQENDKKENFKIVTSTTLFAYMHNNYLLALQNLDPLVPPN